MSPWLLWAVIGFAPTLALLAFYVRAARSNTSAAWADYGDAATLCDWVMPALIILAAIPLASLPRLPNVRLAALCVLPLLLSNIAATLAYYGCMRHLYGDIETRARHIIGSSLRSTGPAVAVWLCLLLMASEEGNLRLVPNVGLYVGVAIADWVGAWVFSLGASSSSHMPGKWAIMAPCELYSRAVKIAETVGVKLSELRILTEVRCVWAGGWALGAGRIALTEDLIRRFPKNEVDAVIAHEMGHLTHRVLWWLYQPLAAVGWLAWIAAGVLADKGIGALPSSLQFLHYAWWITLFIVPHLAIRWYCRRNERVANSKMTCIGDPKSAISADFRLMAIDKVCYSRPWWSATMSTYPTMEECVKTSAARHGIDEAELEAIRNAAQGDSDGEHYELVYHSTASEDRVPHPDDRRMDRGNYWALTAAVMALFATFPFIEQDSAIWRVGLMLGAPIGAAVAVGLILERWRRRVYQRYIDAVMSKLSDLYGEVSADSMLAVDSITMGDWDEQIWQGALLGVSDDHLVVLTESGKHEIDLSSLDSAAQWGEQDSSSHTGVALSYEIDGAPQWIMLRPIGQHKKGRPHTSKQLEGYLQGLLASAGADLRPPDKLTRKGFYACARRVPFALLLTAAAVGLAEGLSRVLKMDFRGAYWLIFFLVVWPLISWVAAGRHDGQEDAEKHDTK